jgi:prephenate dehydrogenase
MKILIDGLGMMGGSLAKVLAERRDVEVFLLHRRPEVAQEAQSLGWGTAISSLSECSSCDLAIVCTPVAATEARVRAIHAASPQCLITDIGSVKAPIMERLREVTNFVGSHPMCGSHLQGLKNADASIWSGATCVVTANCVESFWKSLGMRVVCMDAQTHDAAVARVSHLMHVLAFLGAAQVTPADLLLAAGSWRDTTRVAGSSPELWAGILMENRSSVLRELNQLGATLTQLQKALETQDLGGVNAILESGHRIRQGYDNT